MSDRVIKSVTGTAVPIRGNDIDTDRIIPARYLIATTFDGIEEGLFKDERFEEDGSEITSHPLNQEKFKGSSIMIAETNFGCGSSREHAPQSIKRSGIDAIIGGSFAEIFRGNCKALGIPTVTLGESDIKKLLEFVESNPETELTIDLENKTVTYDGNSIAVDIPTGMQESFLNGMWDSLGILKDNIPKAKEVATKIPYFNFFK